MDKKPVFGLVVVDVQGKLARLMHNSETMIQQTAVLIQVADLLGMPVLWLEQNPEKLGATVEELASLLQPREPIVKYSFDGCGEPAFQQAVDAAAVDHWLLCGIEAHICVYQTARGLHARNFQVSLMEDCIGSRVASNRELAIANCRASGIAISSVEMWLFETLQDCRHPLFREVLTLIR